MKWLLFDAVGTLIYPSPSVPEAYAAAGRRFGSQLDADTIATRSRAALAAHFSTGEATSEARERSRWRAIVAAVFDDVAPRDELFEQLWNHFGRPENWRLFDDVAPTLARLAARGWRLGIASNFDARLLAIVAGHPALAACEQVFVSSQVGSSKPSLLFFREIERRLSAHPGQLLLVGDDELNDVQGATAAGWTAVRLDRTAKRCDENTIRSLTEILDSPFLRT